MSLGPGPSAFDVWLRTHPGETVQAFYSDITKPQVKTMKASKLIEQLQEMINKRGDFTVATTDGSYGIRPVNGIEFWESVDSLSWNNDETIVIT